MLVVPTLILPRDDELEVLGRTVEQSLGRSVQSIDVIGRDPLSRTFSVAMQDGNHLIARIADSHMPIGIMESEIATMKFVHERTSIPVPKILAYELDQSHPLGAHILLEKVSGGVRLDTIFDDLPAEVQDSLVTQLAHFMLEASHLSFPAIGSILLPQSPGPATDPAAVPPLGPLTHPCFYVDGRNALSLDRGPFPTARAYFLACAERERAATRALFASGVGAPAGAEYQALLADTHALVERAVTLLIELVRRCEGLDGADAELARYSLDLHELGPKNVIVAPDEPTRILAVVDWQSASVRPLWRCARTPYWLLPSLVGDDDARKQRLRSVFRAAVAGDPVFARAVDTDDTRHALDEVAEYDTFRDGFLVLPTLQSILATLPGEEDVDGLRKLLDPQTLVGRAARISLLTHGPGVLSLATSTPGSPLSDSPVSFGWNRKLYRYSVPATPRYSVPPTPIA
ncbi:hypothetical protein EDB92DRAFT_239679 [Lactarius akahatsu]|uniref:Altered inheritance of mitochondria protein 9, mitochondrial n=1 Tax=Lactarius akahatsu TaxID=416441 RepID=A0AAD4LJ04_9AGAM|nr:hypothetical protein EDB92DRAFT_239679 [Lactarius akahatsu]